MATEITFEELEAHYFDFMRRVCLGESFTITLDGSAVALLRPVPGAGCDEEAARVFEELGSPRFAGASDDTIREWLGEGPSKP
jgi:antitoxin (DNA-binding transcriptional repressor) of toxin-antitoxin stability system